MTTQPDRPYAGEDELEEESGPAGASAPPDEDNGARQYGAGGIGSEDSMVIVAEVIDEEPVSRASYEAGPTGSGSMTGAAAEAEPLGEDAQDDEMSDDTLSHHDAPSDDTLSDGTGLAPVITPTAVDEGPANRTGTPANGGVSQEWHDIQAMFVDDPRASVQLAVEAAEAAVSSLVESLRERQAGLRPSASSAAATSPPDTEQLREALRQYRMFCEAVSDLGRRLPQVSGLAG